MQRLSLVVGAVLFMTTLSSQALPARLWSCSGGKAHGAYGQGYYKIHIRQNDQGALKASIGEGKSNMSTSATWTVTASEDGPALIYSGKEFEFCIYRGTPTEHDGVAGVRGVIVDAFIPGSVHGKRLEWFAMACKQGK